MNILLCRCYIDLLIIQTLRYNMGRYDFLILHFFAHKAIGSIVLLSRLFNCWMYTYEWLVVGNLQGCIHYIRRKCEFFKDKKIHWLCFLLISCFPFGCCSWKKLFSWIDSIYALWSCDWSLLFLCHLRFTFSE